MNFDIIYENRKPSHLLFLIIVLLFSPKVCTSEDSCRYGKVSELFVYEKFSRVPAASVEAGDICAVCGIDDIQVRIHQGFIVQISFYYFFNGISTCNCNKNFIFEILFFDQIGETIADKVSGKPLPTIKVEEPTVKMSFSINTAPFVGREVCLWKDTLQIVYMAFPTNSSPFFFFRCMCMHTKKISCRHGFNSLSHFVSF